MIRYLFALSLSFFCFQQGFAYESISGVFLGSREGDPASLVENVSVIHGDYTEVEVDLIVPAPDSLILSRFYSSRDTVKTAMFGGWRFNPHCFLSVRKDPKGKSYTTADGKMERTYVYVGNPDGTILTYVGWQNTTNPSKHSLFKIDPEIESVGLANTARGAINSWTNLKNNELYFNPQTNSFELLLCSQGKRFYEKHPSLDGYFITQEVLPSGNKIFYEFDEKGQLTFIKETNALEKKVLAWIQIQYEGGVHIETSDGKTADYHFEKDPSETHLLTEVIRSGKPDVQYQYQVVGDHSLLLRKILPEGHLVQIDYYKDGGNQYRVQSVSTPVETSKTANISFAYGENYTEVLGPGNRKTVYRYDEDYQLVAVEQYLNGSIYRIHKKSWGTRNDAANLISSSIEDANGNIFYHKSFVYDDANEGNIIKEYTCGNLMGADPNPLNIDEEGKSSGETHIKNYSYFSTKNTYGFTQKDEKGTGIKFWYKKGTNLLLNKFIFTGKLPDGPFYHDSGIKKRHFYEYNEDAALIRITVDDGNYGEEKYTHNVSERLITLISPKQELPGIGTPEILEEKYFDTHKKKEILLKRIVNQFDGQGNISSQSIYDANENFAFAITKESANGLLIFETDPVGNQTEYSYDANRNLISERHVDAGLSTNYSYDLSNRLIHTTEKDTRGKTFETHITYDAAGNKISEIDRYGNKTLYEYDSLGRLTRATYPEMGDGPHASIRPTYTYAYDLFDNQIAITDPKGRTIAKAYNVRGNPTAIHHIDGTSELFKYDLEGSLHRYFGRDGIVQVFEYDYIGNLSHIEYYKRGSTGSNEGFKRKYYDHNVFHLTSEKYEKRESTTYRYDNAGRLVTLSEGNQKVEFLYDALSRMHGIKRWQSSDIFTLEMKKYDLLNRVIQKHTEDEWGNQILKTRYIYNNAGNLAQVIGYPQNKESILVEYEYDGFGRISKIIDASNQATQIAYDDSYINEWGQKKQKKILIDPIGNRTEEIYGISGHLTKSLKKDKSGRVLSEIESFYDLSGNKVCEKAARISPKGPLSTYETEWSYNRDDQLQSITLGKGDSKERITTFEYNSYGDSIAKYVPGLKEPITYQYDTYGDLEKISYKEEAKQSINQLFSDKIGNITKVKLASSQVLTYSYNPNDLLLTETIEDHFGSYKVERTYNKEGKIHTLKLPDGSSIAYTYGGSFINTVLRFSKEGKELYNYQVASRDLMGNILEEILPGYAGGRKQAWDFAGRRTEISTNFFQDKIPDGGYDPLGNIIARETTLDDKKRSISYEYDPLSQLTVEKGEIEHQYAFDSIGNRLQKNRSTYKIDGLNQLIETESIAHTFDANGNLIAKTIGEKTWVYQWNPLNHLVSIKDPEQNTITFTYDLSGRRLTKQIETNHKTSKIHRYFYLGDTEIGCLDEKGTIIELKIPGDPNHPEISSYVAIEIKRETYVPLHDLQGNIISLLDHQRRKIMESYRYSSFGEEEITNARGKIVCDSSTGNPWRYQGKRVDKETGLIYFGHRYYDPEVGRWISPDPAGNLDGPNLYAFARNNPITYVDYFGLAAEVNENQSKEFSGYFYGEYEPHCHCEGHRDCKRGGDIGTFLSNPRFQGSMQVLGGLAEASAGGLATFSTGGIAAPIGWPVLAHGLDQFITGLETLFTGSYRPTATEQLLQKTGMSPEWVSLVDSSFSIAGSMGGIAIIRASRLAAFPNFRILVSSNNSRTYVNRATSFAGSKRAPLNYAPYQRVRNEPAVIYGRKYTGHALDRMQDRSFMPSIIENTISKGQSLPGSFSGTIEYYDAVNKVKVVVGKSGQVITIIPGRG